MPLTRVGKPLLLAAASTLAALLLAELILALFAPVAFRRPPRHDRDTVWRDLLHQPSSVPGLAYELRPGAQGEARGARVVVNALGMRDDPPRPDDGHLLRVAVLGDSYTFGFGVDVRDTYPAQLESLLAAKHEPARCTVDVLNFGVSGYNTVDEAAQLAGRVVTFRPDAVVVGYVLNDPQLEPIQPLQTHFAPVRWWQRSNVLRLIAQAKQLFDQKRYGGGDFFEYLHAPAAGFWPKVEDAFDRIAAVAGQLGAPVVVVIFPIVPDGAWDAYAYRSLHAQVADAVRRRGMEVVDLLPVFEAYDPARLRLDAQDEHPTPLADALVAQALVPVLEPALQAACERNRP